MKTLYNITNLNIYYKDLHKWVLGNKPLRLSSEKSTFWPSVGKLILGRLFPQFYHEYRKLFSTIFALLALQKDENMV